MLVRNNEPTATLALNVSDDDGDPPCLRRTLEPLLHVQVLLQHLGPTASPENQDPGHQKIPTAKKSSDWIGSIRNLDPCHSNYCEDLKKKDFIRPSSSHHVITANIDAATRAMMA